MRYTREKCAQMLYAWAGGLPPSPGPELRDLVHLLARTATPQGQTIKGETYAARQIPRSAARRLELLRLGLDLLQGTPFLPDAGRHGRTLLATSSTSREDADTAGRTYQRWLAFEALIAWGDVPPAWWEALLTSTAIGHPREWQRLALLGQRVTITESLADWAVAQPPHVAGLVLGASWPQWEPVARESLGQSLLERLHSASEPPSATAPAAGAPSLDLDEEEDQDLAAAQTAQTLLRGLLRPTERVALISELAQVGTSTGATGNEGQLRWILERWQTAGPPLDRRAWAPLLQSGDRWIREQALKAIGGGAPPVAPSYPERATPLHPRPLR